MNITRLSKEKKYKNMPDLTRQKEGKSVSLRIEELIIHAEDYIKSPEDLKKDFLRILEDPTTHVSSQKIYQYKEDLRRKKVS